MVEPRKIYISEKIDGQNVATTTRGIHRTDQGHRADSRGPRICGIYIFIKVRLWWSVDGKYREY